MKYEADPVFWIMPDLSFCTRSLKKEKSEGRKDKKKPGDDLLSHGRSRSTIGEEAFHGRVRDGNVWEPPLYGHQENCQ